MDFDFDALGDFTDPLSDLYDAERDLDSAPPRFPFSHDDHKEALVDLDRAIVRGIEDAAFMAPPAVTCPRHGKYPAAESYCPKCKQEEEAIAEVARITKLPAMPFDKMPNDRLLASLEAVERYSDDLALSALSYASDAPDGAADAASAAADELLNDPIGQSFPCYNLMFNEARRRQLVTSRHYGRVQFMKPPQERPKPMQTSTATARWIAKIQAAPTKEDLEVIGAELKTLQEDRNSEREPVDPLNLSGVFEAQDLEAIDFERLRKEYGAKLRDLRTIKVSGTSFRQAAVSLCQAGDMLRMVPDPFGREMGKITRDYAKSAHKDPTAVMLCRKLRDGGLEPVGYVPKAIAPPFYGAIMNDLDMTRWEARVVALVGGPEVGLETYGLRVELPPLR